MRHLTLSCALLACCLPAPAQTAPPKLQVFILAGQSNMEGKARLSLAERQAKSDDPALREFYEPLRDGDHWLVRHDVWIDFLVRHGELTVGYGSPNCIGPELGFGMVVGDAIEAPVLLIKTAWGGKSLGRDFLPPSSPLPSHGELQQILAKENDANLENKRRPITLDAVRERYGKSYRDMMAQVHEVLDNLKQRFPDYQDQGYEIRGFVWFQGWNDQYDESFLTGYQRNLANLIRDVRKDLNVPDLPVVVGQMGQNGLRPAKGAMARIVDAQTRIAQMPGFVGNVASIPTDVYWDKDADALVEDWQQHKEAWEKVGSDRGYHYLGSVRTFVGIGRGLGEAMVKLLAK